MVAADSWEAFAGSPSLSRSTPVGGSRVYYPSRTLLMNHQVFQARTILSRTSRHLRNFCITKGELHLAASFADMRLMIPMFQN
jgi:hypothetical protein